MVLCTTSPVRRFRAEVSMHPDWITYPHPDGDATNRALRGGLRALGFCLPGDWLRTFIYLNLIARPRKLLRRAITGFYRFDHVHDVLREFASGCAGPLTILEFGTGHGYATAKLLYATRYQGLEDRVTLHGFDSFEGLPTARNPEDRGFRGNDWIPGSYRGTYDKLRRHCERQGYRNCRIHAGYFEDTITDALLAELRETQPILVWIDCDLYTSSRTVMERLIPILPTGCVLYFDDIDFNYKSRFTGQARLIHEINGGLFGSDVELVLDPDLSWNSQRIYRFIRYGDAAISYRALDCREAPPQARPIGNGSPLP
jgi:hypothetical protein